MSDDGAAPAEQTAQLRHDYKKVFSTTEGQNVLRDMARYSQAMVSVTKRYPEPHTIAYAEGMRQLFWYIFAQVHDTAPERTESTPVEEPIMDAFADIRREVRQ